MMDDTASNSFFKLTSCTSLPKMKQKIDYALRTEQDDINRMMAWSPYNFPATTIKEVQDTWRNLLTNYAQKNVERRGRPLKKVGYTLVLSPRIPHDLLDDFRNCVLDFVDNNLMDNFLVMTYHLDTNFLHAHLLIHAVTVDLRAWRMPPADLVAFRNAWFSSCKQFNLPSPLDPRSRDLDRLVIGNTATESKKILTASQSNFPLATGSIYVPFEEERDESTNRGAVKEHGENPRDVRHRPKGK